MIKLMEKEFIITIMVQNIQENGKTIFNTVMDMNCGLMVQTMKVVIQKE